jgi:hypothetical protein
MIASNLAITLFCRIIGELPKEARSTAVDFTCVALGQPPQPTGTPFSPDRPLRHLAWDNEITDLFNRLVYLVSTVGIKEQLIVQGAMSYVVTLFNQRADQDSADASTAAFQATVEKVNSQLALPVEKREGRQSDEELTRFLGQLNDLIATADERRQAAEDARNQLQERFESTFSLQFWEALNALQLERLRPLIDDLLREDEDRGEAE